jgi:penicillin amidase
MYVYELHPEDENRYLYEEAWEPFHIVEEQAAVAAQDDVHHQLAFTRHGPVVHKDVASRRAVAVRAVWLQPGMAPYLASLEYQGAKDTTEFRRALRRWGAPGVNMVYASVDGDIGWQACGMVPVRTGWDGSLPVPGHGGYEWERFAYVEELPSVHNPPEGWFSTSNENNVPGDFDSPALPPTTDWYSSARHERLTEWFESGEPIDVEASIRMQGNSDNIHARELLDALAHVSPSVTHQEWADLQAWDCVESADSRTALIFQIWQRRHLRPWLVDTCLKRLKVSGSDAVNNRDRLLRADSLVSDLRPDIRMVSSFNDEQGADVELLSEGVERTLGSALTEIEAILGPDRPSWTWGSLHRTILRHAVLFGAMSVPPEWGALPAIPRAGSGNTVGLAGYDDTFNAVMGSSFRIAVDVGEWDRSLVLNFPGQSGDPRSQHYADLVHMWADGDAFPLKYSRAEVESETVTRIILRTTVSRSEPAE